jgi:hypothetical protein
VNDDLPALTLDEMDDVLGFCVALMQAGVNKDMDGMSALINARPDAVHMMPALVGIAVKLGIHLHGRDHLRQLLAAWEPGRGIPGIHRPAD